MIWLYERNGAIARLETSYDDDTAEYVLRFVDPILGASVERFSDGTMYTRRLVALEAELKTGEWHVTGTPQIVPDGFPRTRPEK